LRRTSKIQPSFIKASQKVTLNETANHHIPASLATNVYTFVLALQYRTARM